MPIDHYCVFGNPIQHSLSPEIHRLFAEQTGQTLRYEKQLVELNAFEQTVRNFFNAGGKGLNITVPFKQQAWELAVQRSERALLAGAVNTLWLNDQDDICGDNTDGAGLVRDICERLQWPLKEKTVLMLGAGGAARGVLLPLLQEKPTKIVIANRTPSKALVLQELFRNDGDIRAATFTELAGQSFDLIINATSASLSDELPPLPPEIVHEHTRGYDMVYAREPTPFMRWCTQHGALAVSNGLGMLVGQAAESFRIWRGVKPEITPVIEKLLKR